MSDPRNICLWEVTSREAPPLCAEFPDGRTFDVGIVGAGIMGLSAALHLAGQGKSVVLLEAGEIGSGASGRNGGQVQAGYGLHASKLRQGLDGPQARTMTAIADGAADLVFSLIDRHEIECDPVRAGLLRGVHHRHRIEVAKRQAHGDPALAYLGSRETADLIGADIYFGALLDRRAGSINPMAYTRGLCRAALAAGACIVAHSPVTVLARQADCWVVQNNQGSLRVGSVILATNAYSDSLQSGLAQSIVTVNSFQVATTPLENGPLPQGHIASDTRRLVFYFRRDARGRLVVGGRGTNNGMAALDSYNFLIRWIQNHFSGPGREAISHFWSGRVGLTSDAVPHIHEPEPGLHIIIGFNGKGIALATAMGKCLSDRILLNDPSRLGLPITPIRRIPFWRFRHLGIAAHIALYRFLDRLGR